MNKTMNTKGVKDGISDEQVVRPKPYDSVVDDIFDAAMPRLRQLCGNCGHTRMRHSSGRNRCNHTEQRQKYSQIKECSCKKFKEAARSYRTP